MLISFIIPHKGRHDLLRLTIDSIFNQNFDLDLVEVIVVSQNNDLRAEDISKEHGDKVKIIIRPESDTISTLRNIGVKNSNGNYLAFLDADVELSTNWLESMLSELQSDPNRRLVSAAQDCHTNAPMLEKIRTQLSNCDIDQAVSFLPGRNLFLTLDTFKKAGEFPEHLITCEDYYFTHNVAQLGLLYYSSKASYIHLGEDKKHKEMFHKEIWRGQSNLQSLRGRKMPLREIPSFLVPFWLFFFFITMIISVMFLNLALTTFSLIMLLVPLALYSLRLFKIAQGSLSFIDIMSFYIVYFPARVIGTLGGIIRIFKA
jgi:glycosyltransferase involved in cell wall biosynthesis